MKTECTVCGQEWASTFEPHIGHVCQGCKGHLALAEVALTDNTGMCPPPHYNTLWWKQLKERGEVTNVSW
jgi:hypothetical protein